MTTKGRIFRSIYKHSDKSRTDQEITFGGIFRGTGGRKARKGSRRATRR